MFSRWLHLVVVGAAFVCCVHKPPPPSISTTVVSTERFSGSACGGCHAVEAEEWRTSMHRAAYTSADFQRSYRAEHREYCADCHAPLRTADGARDGTSGIGCIACHTVREGHLASTTNDRPRVATKECKACHDFDAPGTRAILQSTAREHGESSFSATPCEGCHMRSLGGGHRDHRFAVSRNAELLGHAIRVHSARIEQGAVVVQLASNGVGHRFPTGDIYRRLTVTLTAFSKDDGVIAGDTFYLNRNWDNHRASLQSPQRPEAIGVGAEEGDTRLTDAPREFRIACACAREPARVHLTVTYERGAGAYGELFEAFESLEILDTDINVDAISAISRDQSRSEAAAGR